MLLPRVAKEAKAQLGMPEGQRTSVGRLPKKPTHEAHACTMASNFCGKGHSAKEILCKEATIGSYEAARHHWEAMLVSEDNEDALPVTGEVLLLSWMLGCPIWRRVHGRLRVECLG
mmetsp:Transcript_96404/g.241699  ORF Transcript_96404/g.241699 Transcript_96404/m.241699 type:complete len:116 (-) Transcript_96404:191-538(-)